MSLKLNNTAVVITGILVIFSVFVAYRYNTVMSIAKEQIAKLEEENLKLNNDYSESQCKFEELLDLVLRQNQQAENLEQQLSKLNETLSALAKFKATITAYTPCERECDKTPKQTATLGKPKPGITCAVSRDRIELLGKWIKIEGVGMRYCNDLLNEKYHNRVDLVMASRSGAKQFGKRTAEVVLVAEKLEH